MKLSDAGVQLIANFEGFRSHPYQDAVGVWTIGYGSTKGVGPRSKPVTREQALERLKREVQDTYGAAVDALHLPLNQNQYDATVSFVYNLGPGVLSSGSTFGRLLRGHHFTAAANAMLLYVNAGGRRLLGLVNRRRAERALFLKPAHGKAQSRKVQFTRNERRTLDLIMKVRARKSTPARRAAIRGYKATLLVYRAKLRAAAKLTGWGRADRRRRYAALLDVYKGGTCRL